MPKGIMPFHQLPYAEHLDFIADFGAWRAKVTVRRAFYDLESDQHVVNHSHAAYEIQVVRRGTMVLSIEDGYYEISEGGLCLIAPGVSHAQLPRTGQQGRPASAIRSDATAKQDERVQPVQKSCFSFRCERSQQTKFEPNSADELRSQLERFSFVVVPAPPALLAALEEVKKELLELQIGWELKTTNLFAQIIIDVIRLLPAAEMCKTAVAFGNPRATAAFVMPGEDYGPAAPAVSLGSEGQNRLVGFSADSVTAVVPDEQRIAIIEHFFLDNFSQPLKEGELAELLFMSCRQLNRVLHELYGMSFRRKLLDTRMLAAMDLLKNTSESVKTIAAAVGYPYVENFYNHFKAKTKMTPAEYRRSVANTVDAKLQIG